MGYRRSLINQMGRAYAQGMKNDAKAQRLMTGKFVIARYGRAGKAMARSYAAHSMLSQSSAALHSYDAARTQHRFEKKTAGLSVRSAKLNAKVSVKIAKVNNKAASRMSRGEAGRAGAMARWHGVGRKGGGMRLTKPGRGRR